MGFSRHLQIATRDITSRCSGWWFGLKDEPIRFPGHVVKYTQIPDFSSLSPHLGVNPHPQPARTLVLKVQVVVRSYRSCPHAPLLRRTHRPAWLLLRPFWPSPSAHLRRALTHAPHSHASALTPKGGCRNLQELGHPWSPNSGLQQLTPATRCPSKPFLPSQMPPAFLSQVPPSTLTEKSHDGVSPSLGQGDLGSRGTASISFPD